MHVEIKEMKAMSDGIVILKSGIESDAKDSSSSGEEYSQEEDSNSSGEQCIPDSASASESSDYECDTELVENQEEARKPRNVIKLTNAVKEEAGFDGENSSYKSPSLTLKTGDSLRKVSDLVQGRALMADDQEAIRPVSMFQKLYETKWSEFVSHSALTNLSEAKYNKASPLPLTRDTQKLHEFLHQETESALRVLKEKTSAKDYAALASLTLCQVILFNRRRAGEVSKMT
ncbi:hypothetical protein SRHO_G00079920 [Serrasalmus rhombeus]